MTRQLPSATWNRPAAIPTTWVKESSSVRVKIRSIILLGCACVQLGQNEQAAQRFVAATGGATEPGAALYYNDQPPDTILYQALAHRKLGAEQDAITIAQKLVDYGETLLDEPVTVDYFAVSLPDFLVFDDDMQRRHRVHCLYMAGLGYLGLGSTRLLPSPGSRPCWLKTRLIWALRSIARWRLPVRNLSVIDKFVTDSKISGRIHS